MTELEAAAKARRRGTIALDSQACTSCMICVRECPVWCIELAAHSEQEKGSGGRRGRSKYVLDSFSIDYSLCMECGICIDVCPTDALSWESQATDAAASPQGLVLPIERLAPRASDS